MSSSSSISTKFDIEKFDGTSSFALWQVRMKAILSNLGVKATITGRPKDLEGDENSKEWETMNDRALSTIQLCLSDSTLQEILSVTTAVDAWKKLEEIFMKKSVTNRLRLKQRFHSLRMAENTSVKAHVSEYTALLNDMERIGIKVEDEDKAIVLLCSLPKSYQGFKETMLHSRVSLTLEDVKSNLLVKSDIENNLTTSERSNQEVGLYVERGRNNERKHHQGRSRSKSAHKNLSCNYCKKKGHIVADCYKLKNKQKAQKGISSGEANVADSEVGDLLFVGDGKEKFDKNWVMDTGASQHMTPNREWFATYEATNEGGVLLGNDHLCKVAGVGTVKIKMHDGVTRTLTGVRHIPDLTKNLISMGSLEDVGCKFQSEGGVLKVSKGALTMMKAKKVGTLYFLEGTTIIGSAAVASSTSDSDITKLWHMRLGHMSERGMAVLSKRGLLCG